MLNQRVFDYFNGIAEKIACEHRITATGKNATDIGFNREIIIEKFLANHIPNRLKVYQGGHIFGTGEKSESKQIDIIIANDIGLNFKEHQKMFTAIENVAAAFSIKSTLNKKELIDSLENIASIPMLSKNVVRFIPDNLGNHNNKSIEDTMFKNFDLNFPLFFIFAFKGVRLDTTIDILNNFYNSNKKIPHNRRPTKIIINKNYYITYSPNKLRTSGGKEIQPYTFYPVKIEKNISGIPFFHLINYLVDYVRCLSKMEVNYQYYANSFLEKLYLNAK